MAEPVEFKKIGIAYRRMGNALRATAELSMLKKLARAELEQHGQIVDSVTWQVLDDDLPHHIRILFSTYVIPHQKKEPEPPLVEPTMNIVNQINAGLNDLRTTLVAITQGDVEGIITGEHKAKYQLELVVDMINDNRTGKKIPWSDRKLQVEEEFS